MKGIKRYNDGVILLVFLSLAMLTAFCMHPIVIIMSFLGAAALMFSYKSFSKSLLKLFGLLAFSLFFAVFNPIISHKGVSVLFYVNGNPYTLEALIYGFFSGIMISSVLLWFYNINAILSPDSIIYVSGRFFPKLSLVMSMCFKTLPIYVNNAKEISDCTKTLGKSGQSFISKLKSTASVFSTLITTVPEDVIETALSMNCRGFGAQKYRSFSKNKIKTRDILIIVSYIALFIMFFNLSAYDYRYYPSFSWSYNDIFLIAVIFLLMLIPAFIQIKENILWLCLKSKI